MNDASDNPRIELIREAAIFQIKLLADGLRDALLIPFSLLAALVGVFRGGPDCGREFHRVLKMGRRSERWINLFGHEQPLGRRGPGSSMDAILDQVETTVMEQYRKGKSAEHEDMAPDSGPSPKPPKD